MISLSNRESVKEERVRDYMVNEYVHKNNHNEIDIEKYDNRQP